MSQSTAFTPRAERAVPKASEKPRLVRLAPATKARRPLLAAGCLVVVIGSAAVVASAFAHTSSHAQVLVARYGLSPGSVISPSDVTTATISGTGAISAIPVSQEGTVVGRTVSVALVAGEVIPKGAVGAGLRLQSGNAVVGMSLTVDQLPAGGVAPGQDVEVVVVSPPGSPATGGVSSAPPQAAANPFGAASSALGAMPSPGTVLVSSALVYRASPPPASSAANYAEDVSLEVPQGVSSQIVTLAAAKQIGLALVPEAIGANP